MHETKVIEQKKTEKKQNVCEHKNQYWKQAIALLKLHNTVYLNGVSFQLQANSILHSSHTQRRWGEKQRNKKQMMNDLTSVGTRHCTTLKDGCCWCVSCWCVSCCTSYDGLGSTTTGNLMQKITLLSSLTSLLSLSVTSYWSLGLSTRDQCTLACI